MINIACLNNKISVTIEGIEVPLIRHNLSVDQEPGQSQRVNLSVELCITEPYAAAIRQAMIKQPEPTGERNIDLNL